MQAMFGASVNAVCFGQVVGNTCICHLASKRSTLLLDSQQVVVGAASKEGFAEDLIAARNLVLYGLFLIVVVFCSGIVAEHHNTAGFRKER